MSFRHFKQVMLCGFLSCSSCMHLNVPPARLEFVSIDRVNSSYYDLRFTSDRNLVDLYKAHGREGQIGTWIHCSLNGDPDFSIEHTIVLEASGIVSSMRLIEGDRRYEMLAAISVENHALDDGRNYVRPSELIQILKPQQYVPCKAVITAFPFVAYYSKVMYVPASRFIHAIESPWLAPARISLEFSQQPRSLLPFASVCIVRWRYEPAGGYDHIDRLGSCSDVPYAGMLASFAPYTTKLKIVSGSEQAPEPFAAYTILRGDGRQEPGIADENGRTHEVGASEYEVVKILINAQMNVVERWTKWTDSIP